jgi:hypothetical protein
MIFPIYVIAGETFKTDLATLKILLEAQNAGRCTLLCAGSDLGRDIFFKVRNAEENQVGGGIMLYLANSGAKLTDSFQDTFVLIMSPEGSIHHNIRDEIREFDFSLSDSGVLLIQARPIEPKPAPILPELEPEPEPLAADPDVGLSVEEKDEIKAMPDLEEITDATEN